jgi:hypothetical protein
MRRDANANQCEEKVVLKPRAKATLPLTKRDIQVNVSGIGDNRLFK